MRKTTNRAVSTAVGVILMVAIVVIMAAAIGGVIFDMGAAIPEKAPQASLEMSDADDNFGYASGYPVTDGEHRKEEFIQIYHNGGDSLSAEKIIISIHNSSNFELAQWNGTVWSVTSTDADNADNVFFNSSAGNLNNIVNNAPFDPNPFSSGGKITIVVKEPNEALWGDGGYHITLVGKSSNQLIAEDTVTVQ
jgi:hypothetical protein